jgi:hypothetical protein
MMEATPRFELGMKALQASALPLGYAASSLLVPETGIEPVLRNRNRILSPARLPIPPLGHFYYVFALVINGAGEGIRTLDPNLGKVVLYP